MFTSIITTYFKGSPIRMVNTIALVFCLLCGGAYLFMIGASTSFISQEHIALQSIRDTHTRIAHLESEFLELQNTLSRRLVLSQGYIDAQNPVYVESDPRDSVVVMRGQ